MPSLVLRPRRELMSLFAVCAVVVMVVIGLGRGGVWVSNIHNGLLALMFTFVGAYIAAQRPDHREASLFLATGLVEAVMFLGRQIGHSADGRSDSWWAWLGVWPLALALGLVTLSVICFPDGRLPSDRWRPVVLAVVGIAVVSAALSALWPVEYASVGIATQHPLNAHAPDLVARAWSAVAHPAYGLFQVLWIVALVSRWRTADGRIRRQLLWLAWAAAASVAALAIGLVLAGTHVPGVLAATLIPLAAGWAIVHGQHTTAYAALSWLSRTDTATDDLPAGIAATVAEALSAPGATVWTGPADALHAIGTWPAADTDLEPATISSLRASEGEVREIVRDGAVVGALSIRPRRAGPLTRAEVALLDDLTAQAAWVIEHIGLTRLVAYERAASQIVHLTRRERDVLELMARGLTNRAICDELHLSIKTIEPIVSSIFTKLELDAGPDSNRRVLAVLAYLHARNATGEDERSISGAAASR